MATENTTPTEETKAAEDFDLGEYMQKDAPKSTKPRVHIGGSTCVSCEG